MYKHTYTSTSERYLLDERIQNKINNDVDKLMKKLEYSLLHNAYPNVNKEKSINEECNSFEELSDLFQEILIKERILEIDTDSKMENIFDLDMIESKKLLISLYEYYLREEMVEYTDFGEIDEVKKKKGEKIEENFKTFLSNKNDKDYIEDFDKEINKVFKNQQLMRKIYVNRPKYFLLYRIRNNILKEVRIKTCSEKHFRNMIKDIKNQYRKLYLNQYNKDFFYKINEFENFKKDILNHVEKELLDNIRSGKVINVGNELANNFKQDIKKDEEKNNLIDEYTHIINKDDGFETLQKKVLDFQQKYIDISKKYIDDNTKINERWLKEDIKTFLLYCTVHYIIGDNGEKELEDITQQEMNDIDISIISYLQKEYLQKEKYDVFIKINNIEIEQKEKIQISNVTFIKSRELKNDINKYLNHECKEFEKKYFESQIQSEEEVFVKIENIETYKRDSKFVEELALKKIEDIINVIYFFNARNESKLYQLSDKMLIIETNTEYRLVTRSYREGIFNIQLVSNEWINKIFNENYDNKISKILEALKEYNKLNKSNSGFQEWLICSNKKLLNEKNLYNLAREMSILIAGTNIFKYTVKYFDLRFWLIEDYMEFLDGKLPYDDFIIERFLNFYKRVINIIFSYSDIKDINLIEELQMWILKIFPNNYLYKEDKEDE